MKSIKIFATVGAIALLGTAGFTSCNQNNTPVGPGNYNGETVKTEIVISLPDEAVGTGTNVRYMPGESVQKNGRSQFQGIENIFLLPFAKPSDKIEGSDTRLSGKIELDPITDAGTLGEKSNATYYAEKSVPLTTSAFLFYGKSKAKDITGTDVEKKFKKGSLTMKNGNSVNPSAFEFELESILGTTDMFADATDGKALLDYLTSIAKADDGTTKWYETTDPAFAAMFETFTQGGSTTPVVVPKGMHGLSSAEVKRVMADLYTSLIPFTTGIGKAIKDSIEKPDWVTVSTSGDPLKATVAFSSHDNFPEQYNIPQGSVEIAWNDTEHKFIEGLYGSNMADPTIYTYPAELWYYANSHIKTSNTSQKSMYNATNTWDQILAAYTGSPAVNTSTRSIAIHDSIEYGVGRLDVSIKLADNTLDDNSDLVETNATDVTCSSYPVTAVIIGGQRRVGFNFEVKNPEASAEYTIYDKYMTAAMNATTGGSATNSTLVLESKANEPVMVAIELVNNSNQDFYGVQRGLIPAGGKFYVVGELKATNLKEGTSDVTGGKVFKQDYITTANFTLNSLRNAYNTIPDLRTPQLEIGFSVSLSWKEGNVYDVPID